MDSNNNKKNQSNKSPPATSRQQQPQPNPMPPPPAPPPQQRPSTMKSAVKVTATAANDDHKDGEQIKDLKIALRTKRRQFFNDVDEKQRQLADIKSQLTKTNRLATIMTLGFKVEQLSLEVRQLEQRLREVTRDYHRLIQQVQSNTTNTTTTSAATSTTTSTTSTTSTGSKDTKGNSDNRKQ